MISHAHHEPSMFSAHRRTDHHTSRHDEPISRSAIALLFGSFLALTAVPLLSQDAPTRVDVETNSSDYAVFFDGAQELDGSLLLSGNDPAHGFELWRLDPGSDQPQRITDAFPGPSSFLEFYSLFFSSELGKELFFAGNDLEHGLELWKTDGTGAGTELVEDLVPGTGGSTLLIPVASGNKVFFTCSSPSKGQELCIYDGSTVDVLDIYPGSDSSSPNHLVAAGPGRVCFSADHPTWGRELWCSTGPGVDTRIYANLMSGTASSDPAALVYLGGDELMFAATTSQGREPVHFDLVTEVATVLDIHTGAGDSDPRSIVGNTGIVLFDGIHPTEGRELHHFDPGTGVFTVLPANPGSGSGLDTSSGLVFDPASGLAYFEATDGSTGKEPWQTKGTVGSTLRIADLEPGGDSNPLRFELTADHLFFLATTSAAGREAYVMKIGSSSPELLDLDPGPDSSNPILLATFNGDLVLRANQPGELLGTTYLLSPGTRGATLTPLDAVVQWSGSQPLSLTGTETGVLFDASTEAFGREPRFHRSGPATDLGDLTPGEDSSQLGHLAVDGERAAFIADTGTDQLFLWDGEAPSIVDLTSQSITVSTSFQLRWLNDRLLFEGWNAASQRGLFSLDPGTGAVEQLPVDQFVPDTSPPDPGLALLADGGDLYVTDGTLAGTTFLDDLFWAVAETAVVRPASDPAGFLGLAITSHDDLIRTDGTAGGTEEVMPPTPPSSADLRGFAVQGGRALFEVREGSSSNHWDLWISDGTDAGTFRIFDREEGDGFPEPTLGSLLHAVAGGWVYIDESVDHGTELWFNSGAGPSVVLDLWVGADSSDPRILDADGARVLFAATTPDRGRELWVFENGAAVPLPELHPGQAGETIFSGAFGGGRIYFSVDGPPGDGPELWFCCDTPFFADGFESGNTNAWN